MLKIRKRANKKKKTGKHAGLFLLLLMTSLILDGCRPRNQEPQWLGEESNAETAGTEEKTAEAAAMTESTEITEPQDKPDTTVQESGNGEENIPVQEATVEFYVHVCGAVENPGVYILPAGSRVVDAVVAAGGATENASEEALNQALAVTDGMQVYVPTLEEVQEGQNWIRSDTGQTGSTAGTADSGSGGKININTADAAQLCTLPGIGESRASSIVAYREEHGGFSAIEDIMKVSGIKDAAFGKIKDKICVK